VNLKTVTITGADDSIQPMQLLPLRDKYPCVEFGILLSAKRGGEPRFPSREWIGGLALLKASRPELNLSAHLCGRVVRDICGGDWSEAERLVQGGFGKDSIFGRVQLNFHAELHEVDEAKFLAGLRARKQQFVFQMDTVNNYLFDMAANAGINAVPLFDGSHGNGRLPPLWPEPIYPYCGYAGGLSPANLEEQLAHLAGTVGDCEIWIDCETRVRSNNDQQFDLGLVEAFLEVAAGFVKPATAEVLT
jgi:hypothetical protein